MSLFKGDYLRVMSPVTTNGMVNKFGADGKILYKEDHLPVTAKKGLERRNLKLPDNLKKKIELVSAYRPEPAPTVELKPKK